MSLRENKCEEMNLPFKCINKPHLKSANIYITNKLTVSDCAPVLKDIYVAPEFIHITPEYLNTKITGKDVYANLMGYGGYLPISQRFAPFVITEKGVIPDNGELDYKRIDFIEETTIADLYRNACAYQYNVETDTYTRLPQAGADQNALKYIMQRRITEIAGDPYDRIADLSRIILFLLKKVNLTTEEHTLLDPLLQHAQSAIDLADIFNREHHIQDYVQHVKSDPKGYLNE